MTNTWQGPPKFRTLLRRLRNTIKAAAPDADEVIGYGMPACRQDGMLVYLAAFKDHYSLFVASDEVRRQFSAELKPFMAGKGTLQFTPERPLPADLVTRIVNARVAENAARRSMTGTVEREAKRRRRGKPPGN